MTNELPEVGSRWTIDGHEISFTVVSVKKKGRGYYVETDHGGSTPFVRYRLQDFRKKAKAVTE
jgi:hypothetical protein